MAAAWQASGALAGSTGADITPVNPAHIENDILVLHAFATDPAAITATLATPSGWSLIAGPVDSPGGILRSYWFWKRAGPTTEANPLNDWSATGSHKYGIVHNLRGAATSGNPFAAQATSSFTTADPASATGVTTTAADQLVCSIGGSGDNLATAVTVTATNPASWTQRDYKVTGTGNDAGAWISTAVRATAGATGNVSHDFNGAPLKTAILIVAVLEPTANPQTVTLDHLGPTGALEIPSVNQSVAPAHLGPSGALYQPAAQLQVTLAHLGPTGTLFAPQLIADQFVTLAHLGPTGVLNTPRVDQSIVPQHLGPTSALYPPEVRQAIALALLGPSGALYQPAVKQGVSLAHLGPSGALFAPRVDQQAVLAHLGPTGQLFVPAVQQAGAGLTVTLAHLGPTGTLNPLTLHQAVALSHLGPTGVLFTPAVAQQLALGHLGPTGQLFAQAVRQAVALDHLGPSGQLFGLALSQGQIVGLLHLGPTGQLYAIALTGGALGEPLPDRIVAVLGDEALRGSVSLSDWTATIDSTDWRA